MADALVIMLFKINYYIMLVIKLSTVGSTVIFWLLLFLKQTMLYKSNVGY